MKKDTAVKSARTTECNDSMSSNEVAMVKTSSVQQSVKPLDEAQEQHLAKCEAIIENGIKSFWEVAEALLDIRDQELYRTTHGTFQDYCNDRWGITARHANRLMLAGDVVKNLKSDQLVSLESVAIPQNEAQARPLAPLTALQQVEAARKVAKKAGNHTAEDFQTAAEEVKGKKSKAASSSTPTEDQEEEKPRVVAYDPRKDKDNGDLEKLLALIDAAQTQARKTADCSDVAKALSELAKLITRKLNGGGK
jgi:hypothetical protein